ncbi:MAG: TatD family hydrolase [Desulfobacterales bacterium]|nr:TatD family hydrolase [Desulfobacterales bacterium]
MKIFDSHCHLNLGAYKKDQPAVIDRAKAADVEGMMIVGITVGESRQAVEIAERFPGCYASVGMHPHDAGDCSEDSLQNLEELAKSPAVKAWGETGLDFNRMHSPQAAQEKWFVRQLETADELDLPLIFHERDSEGRFLEILSAHYNSSRRLGVVHCFSGSADEMQAYLKMGFYIGITGILTMKTRGEPLRSLVQQVPPDRMVIETDAPFLTPAPDKNHTRRNEPAFVRTVLYKLAEVLDRDPQALADTLWANTCQLYQISEPVNTDSSEELFT